MSSLTGLRRSAFIGFGLVTLSAVFLLVTLILGTPEPSPLVQVNLLVAALSYLAALGYVVYKFFPFRQHKTAGDPENPSFERSPTTRKLLNDREFAPAADYVSPPAAARTSEPVPVSVTENTTTLLDKE